MGKQFNLPVNEIIKQYKNGVNRKDLARIYNCSHITIYNRLKRTTGIFKNYVTEGDGIRQAAEQGVLVFDISSQNAQKQSEQFKDFVIELLNSL